ncbi:MAG: GNAT family N-acetyltransferase [Alphaproteobacteria bacterium]
MDEFAIDVSDQPADADLIDRIGAGMDETVPNGVAGYAPSPLTITLSEGDVIQGALVGASVWDWLYVNLLWVARRERGRGLGVRLMQAAEAEAEQRGLTGIWVSTYSFQAPTFYEKLGFRTFGRIDDFPSGHVRYFLQKRLDPASI